MKGKVTKETILYFFILLNPILDIVSSVLSFGNYSISTFIRPLIPLGLLCYLFLKEKKVRPYLVGGAIVYILYFFLHLYYYRELHNDFSYGNTLYEASYLCNYTYLIFTFFLFLCIIKKDTKENLIKVMTIYFLIYIGSIVISIVTNTSYQTYLEGFGYRGWFNTGGAVGSILIGLLFILLPPLLQKKEKRYLNVTLLIVTLIYLMFLLGTRVGLLGGVIALVCYVTFTIILQFLKKQRKNKWLPRITFATIILLLGGVLLFGSESINRRKQLDDLKGKIPGDESGTIIYMAYDLVKLKMEIEGNTLPENYMTKEQQEAILKLDEYSTKHQLNSIDVRKQQLLYHHFLYQEQKSIPLKLVGNGYLTNMGMLTLEMEFLSFFYNFGIIGFLLFAGPFLTLFIYSIITGIKNRKNIDVTYLMHLAGCFMMYAIGTLAGHTFFNTSVMIVIIVLHTLLFQKTNEIKEDIK